MDIIDFSSRAAEWFTFLRDTDGLDEEQMLDQEYLVERLEIHGENGAHTLDPVEIEALAWAVVKYTKEQA